MDKELLEKLAGAQHEIWSHWMKYLFTEGYNMPDGKFSIKRAKAERWKEQMNKKYSDLSEEEKESDRQVVMEFIFSITEEIWRDGFESCKKEIDKWNDEMTRGAASE